MVKPFVDSSSSSECVSQGQVVVVTLDSSQSRTLDSGQQNLSLISHLIINPITLPMVVAEVVVMEIVTNLRVNCVASLVT